MKQKFVENVLIYVLRILEICKKYTLNQMRIQNSLIPRKYLKFDIPTQNFMTKLTNFRAV